METGKFVRCRNCGDTVAPGDRCSNCGECCQCCACYVCDNCGEHSFSVCSTCDKCNSCCDCCICEGCATAFRQEDGCAQCNRCSDCECICPSPVEFVSSPLTGFKDPRFHHNGRVLRRFIGTELEFDDFENDTDTMVRSLYKHGCALVSDASLRCDEGEIVTPAANGSKFIEVIEAAIAAARTAGCILDTNCGYHVHVDGRDLHAWETFNLLRIWKKVQSRMWLAAGPGRSKIYCAPLSLHDLDYLPSRKAPTPRLLTLGAVYGDAILKTPSVSSGRALKNTKASHHADARYRDLNVHSLYYRGTVEFRLHEGTANALTAVNWALVCAWIVETAATYTSRQIDALPNSGFSTLRQILPEPLFKWLQGEVQD
jgi:hypothetical protein